jgi:hypothetical protein
VGDLAVQHEVYAVPVFLAAGPGLARPIFLGQKHRPPS